MTKARAQLAAYQGALVQAQATGQQTKVNQSQYQAALAQIAQSEANLNNAKLQLSYTNIVAPSAGRVGNKTAQIGQRVQPGTPLMAITEDDPWVIANFKETQLAHMRIGQPVENSQPYIYVYKSFFFLVPVLLPENSKNLNISYRMISSKGLTTCRRVVFHHF